MNSRGFLLNSVFLVALGALGAGCRRDEPAGDQKAPGKDAIEQVKERGPVKVVLRVEPKSPTFADRVRFTIEATAKQGARVTLPKPGENLGEFIIKDYDAPRERTTADAAVSRQSYVLEFLTSGEFKIPAMSISFTSSSTPSEASAEASEGVEEGKEYQIITDEIPIQVQPLADPASLKDLAPPAPPAEPPPIPRSLILPLTILGALAALGLLSFLAWKVLTRAKPPPPPIPPHERAWRELEWLLGRGFIDRGELKEFFFHLSRILREYIEGRFGLRAPELTTEEFLETLAARSPLPSPGTGIPGGDEIPREHQRLLRDFLQRADLVKFAKYTPGREEIEESFESAKRFIEATLHHGAAASDTRAPGAAAPAAGAKAGPEAPGKEEIHAPGN